jgi:cell division protein FtsQ
MAGWAGCAWAIMAIGDSSRPCSGVRSENLFSKAGSAVLNAPEERYASGQDRDAAPYRRAAAGLEVPRRGGSRKKFAAKNVYDDADERCGGVRLRFDGGLVPRTLWGRIAAGAALLSLIGAAIAGLMLIQRYLLRDEHFILASPKSIQMEGNAHVTRAQMLSVFGGDVERSIFEMPLAERRAELEQLPWIGHATVMRLLPNTLRVQIVERTPVAFVREGNRIELVDAHGVLLDMSSAADGAVRTAERYSFPVLTGIGIDDPLSTRAARMKLYMSFVSALDAGPHRISEKLSEVDLSDPEDVKALIPDPSNAAGEGSQSQDVLVHFGSEKFLERYQKYEEHLTEWRSQYPKLASADMRYDRQVVLEMAKGGAPPSAIGSGSLANADSPNKIASANGANPAPASLKAGAVPGTVAPKPRVADKAKTPGGKPVAKPAAPSSAIGSAVSVNSTVPHHLTTAYPVAAKPAAAAKPAQGVPR